MNTALLKIFILVLILTGCIFVLVFGSPTTEMVFARNVVVAHRFLDSKVLPKKVTLGKDPIGDGKEGEVAFDHETHSSNKKYSPGGETVIGCAECHHTDQPRSDLKPPLCTSERAVVLTVDALGNKDAAVVKGCRTCHFQEGNIPDGKVMRVAVYKDAKGREETKELNNQEAYHLNCMTCHDAAAKLRPELKSKLRFATGSISDCLKCHNPRRKK